ncbi:MAG: MotE family protein [Rickettsiales bacterium]
MAKKIKTPKRRVVRLLPLTVTMLSLLFIIKMNEVYIGSSKLRELYSARDAVAEEKKAEEKKEEHAAAEPTKEGEAAKASPVKPEDAAKAAEAKPADAEAKPDSGVKPSDAVGEPAKPEEAPKKEGEAKPEEAKKEGDAKDAKVEGKAEGKDAKGEHGEAAKGEHGEAKPPEEPKTFGTGKTTVKDIEAMKARDAQPRYSQTELDLLQNLSKRRDDLDRREKDLEIKTRVLDATEKRITDKMSEMKTMQSELSKVLAQYNEKQDGQIKSLVKIYESMKPDEAAAIMNELEMPILLDVIGKMSERKVALVLANMNPKRARDVTQELADKRKKAALNGNQPDTLTPPKP